MPDPLIPEIVTESEVADAATWEKAARKLRASAPRTAGRAPARSEEAQPRVDAKSPRRARKATSVEAMNRRAVEKAVADGVRSGDPLALLDNVVNLLLKSAASIIDGRR